jgi:sulfonate transport system substrate-binding protein
MLSRRGFLGTAAGASLVQLAPPRLARAADKPSEIRIDWATYNPVSMVLKQNGLLEKEFGNDGIGVRWVQSLGSNKALEFLNAGSIDFGSTAGSAALLGKINGIRSNRSTSSRVRNGPLWSRARIHRSVKSRISRASASRRRAAPTRTSSWCARCNRSA